MKTSVRLDLRPENRLDGIYFKEKLPSPAPLNNWAEWVLARNGPVQGWTCPDYLTILNLFIGEAIKYIVRAYLTESTSGSGRVDLANILPRLLTNSTKKKKITRKSFESNFFIWLNEPKAAPAQIDSTWQSLINHT